MPQGIYKEDITMISAGDFRNGLTVLIEGNIYQILEFQHVKPGKRRTNNYEQSIY